MIKTRFKLRLNRGIVGLTVTASMLVLPGCKTSALSGPGNTAQLSPAEQQLQQDGKRFNQTVFGGALIGAAAGGLIAAGVTAIMGGEKKDIGRNAAAGAVVGGAIGGIDGYVTAKKEETGRNELRGLQAATADVQRDNGNLVAFNNSSTRVLAEGRARLNKLRGDVAARRVSTDQANQERRREEQNVASMQDTLAKAKKARDQYTEAAGKLDGTPQARRDLDAEIARMNTQVNQLESTIAEYNRALAVSKA